MGKTIQGLYIKQGKNNMPMVNGKKYDYTKTGMAAAKKASKKMGAKMTMAKPKKKMK
jgi:hypothetical protein